MFLTNVDLVSMVKGQAQYWNYHTLGKPFQCYWAISDSWPISWFIVNIIETKIDKMHWFGQLANMRKNKMAAKSKMRWSNLKINIIFLICMEFYAKSSCILPYLKNLTFDLLLTPTNLDSQKGHQHVALLAKVYSIRMHTTYKLNCLFLNSGNMSKNVF